MQCDAMTYHGVRSMLCSMRRCTAMFTTDQKSTGRESSPRDGLRDGCCRLRFDRLNERAIRCLLEPNSRQVNWAAPDIFRAGGALVAPSLCDRRRSCSSASSFLIAAIAWNSLRRRCSFICATMVWRT
jgi:hypothetical protein